MSRTVPKTAKEIVAAIKAKALFVTSSGLGGIFNVMILEDLGQGL